MGKMSPLSKEETESFKSSNNAKISGKEKNRKGLKTICALRI